jgi:hypothetical protein
MDDDRRDLEQLNLEIGRRESAGDRKGLERIIAPSLAFLKADGSVVDRDGFLEGVKESPPRYTEVTSVAVQGNRAVVECVVTFKEQGYHNLRLFIRQDGAWKLLGWANEPVSAADAAPATMEAGVG